MEKKAIILLLLLTAATAACAENGIPVPVTPVPDAAANTAVSEEETIMDVQLKEIHFNITPEFQFVLPDASLKIGLKQKLGDTMLDASTEYNYLYNKIRYDIRYSLDLFFTFSVNLYDAVNFEQAYQNQKYIQRNKGFGLSVQSPELFDFLILREEYKVDNYYFARLDNAFSPDTGYIMILNSWLELDLSFNDEPIQACDRFAVNFDKSIPSGFSSYNFLFLEVFADKKFDMGGGQTLSLKFEGGYLLEKNDAPIWQIYRLGGYERMIGYNYDEFEGYYKDFIRIRYDTPVFEKINWEWFWLRLDTIRMFTVLDIGCAGTDHEVVNLDHYHYSAGLGITVELTFRKRAAVKMTFALAQAIKQGKNPVFYFMYAF